MDFEGSFQIPLWFDYGATFIWALTGALIAARRGYDIAGIATLALVSATGGGLLRDGIFLQNEPPLFLRTWAYMALVVVAASAVHLAGSRIQHIPLFNRTIAVVDALGLGGFAITGLQLSLAGPTRRPGRTGKVHHLSWVAARAGRQRHRRRDGVGDRRLRHPHRRAALRMANTGATRIRGSGHIRSPSGMSARKEHQVSDAAERRPPLSEADATRLAWQAVELAGGARMIYRSPRQAFSAKGREVFEIAGHPVEVRWGEISSPAIVSVGGYVFEILDEGISLLARPPKPRARE